MIRKASKNDVRIIATLAVLLWDDNSVDVVELCRFLSTLIQFVQFPYLPIKAGHRAHRKSAYPRA